MVFTFVLLNKLTFSSWIFMLSSTHYDNLYLVYDTKTTLKLHFWRENTKIYNTLIFYDTYIVHNTVFLTSLHNTTKWAATCDFQQCGILTSVDSDEPVQPPFKLRNS